MTTDWATARCWWARTWAWAISIAHALLFCVGAGAGQNPKASAVLRCTRTAKAAAMARALAVKSRSHPLTVDSGRSSLTAIFRNPNPATALSSTASAITSA